MRVLVTGSNGFIGGHVCKYLKEKGCYIIGLDLKETSSCAIDEYICCDLSTDIVKDIFDFTQEKTVDAVVHLAADMRHEPYTVSVVTTNCGGTERVLELCEAKNIPVFVQLSSLPVIGKPVQHPIREDHPLAPPTVYHVTKRTQELLADYACYTHGLRTVSFRITAPVGAGMNPNTIFPVFIGRALKNEDLILTGKGTRKQTYIHVRDIAQAIYKAIFSEAHGVYNLSSYNLLSNYELAEKCISVTGSESKIVFSGQEDPMDDYVWDVSLEKIQRDIDYMPEVDIKSAIREYCSYLQGSL